MCAAPVLKNELSVTLKTHDDIDTLRMHQGCIPLTPNDLKRTGKPLL